MISASFFQNPHGGILKAFAFEQLTVDNTGGGVTLTATKYDPSSTGGAGAVGGPPATLAQCDVTVAPINITLDGTAPTAAVGHLRNVGDKFMVVGAENIKALKAFRTTGTSGTLNVTYYH